MAVAKQFLGHGKVVRRSCVAKSATRFHECGCELILGDLTGSLRPSGRRARVSKIESTANAAVPSRKDDTFEAVERLGYRNLVRAATDSGVARFVYTSVPQSTHERSSPFFRMKRGNGVTPDGERTGSGNSSCGNVSLDVAFAMMGHSARCRRSNCTASIPIRGSSFREG